MKVEREKKNLSSFSTVGQTGATSVHRKAEASFDQELVYRQNVHTQGRMQEILLAIDHLGEQMSRSLTIQDLMRYRKLVKDFLKEASRQIYDIERRRGRVRGGRTVLVTIHTIDQEMEALVQDFLQQRREPFEVLETLDKIRGMLVDLMI
ncbi:MAG TPA: YaaR family protein [Syntrophomonadaceae bacterium]|jgi:uncharacterized protein YaaR (DUF327 family)|nr:YaaR family protein [Syntrophomonadaceae bacterium]